MAKVWVYVWNHQRGGANASWGHSSLQVEGGPYISWWPKAEGREYMVDRQAHPMLAGFMGRVMGTSNVYKVEHTTVASYQADIIREKGFAAQNMAEIASGVLNTDRIAEWWAGYAYAGASYHVIKKNCSTTVIRALRAGGADKHVSVSKLGQSGKAPTVDFLSKQKGWEPTDIWAYVKLMRRSLPDRITLSAGPEPVEEPGPVVAYERYGAQAGRWECPHGIMLGNSCADCDAANAENAGS